ncbi:MAG TPA: glycoside hydrolase family 20 zincin-like fold domain-containing protein, partial [Pyrinomonadaceae bacterium]
MMTTLARTLILSAAIVCVLACACARAKGQSANVQIIPAPKQIHVSEVAFVIGRETSIILADGKSVEDRFAAQDFVDDVKQTADVSLRLGGKARREILIGQIDLPRVQQALKRAGVDPGQKLTDEGYVVAVSADEVVVAGKTSTGTFYGLQTLKQLVRGAGAGAFIPGVNIADWPTMRWRAVSDDISRGPVPTVDYIKRQ